jgi:hypothetical protein
MNNPIKNYFENIEIVKKRKELGLTRHQYIQYQKLQEEIKNKSKKELGKMLSEGYRSAFWNVIYHEYKNR